MRSVQNKIIVVTAAGIRNFHGAMMHSLFSKILNPIRTDISVITSKTHVFQIFSPIEHALGVKRMIIQITFFSEWERIFIVLSILPELYPIYFTIL